MKCARRTEKTFRRTVIGNLLSAASFARCARCGEATAGATAARNKNRQPPSGKVRRQRGRCKLRLRRDRKPAAGRETPENPLPGFRAGCSRRLSVRFGGARRRLGKPPCLAAIRRFRAAIRRFGRLSGAVLASCAARWLVLCGAGACFARFLAVGGAARRCAALRGAFRNLCHA